MADIRYYDVILKPVITEKSMNAMADKKYTFMVHVDANKAMIKEAVEKMFPGTKVDKVNTMNIDGRISTTTAILMTAPLAIRIHKELIISILEYNPTPKVAAKKDNALTTIDLTLLWHASATAFFFSIPAKRFLLYFVVIRIA